MRPSLRLGLLLVSSLWVCLGLVVSPALACEAGRCVSSTWPEDGAIEVPNDASIWVFYEVGGPAGLDAQLRGPDGELVPADTRTELGGELSAWSSAVLVLTPLSPLEDSTTYQLELVDPPTSPDLCAGPTQFSFTTGTDLASPPVSFSGQVWVEGEFLDTETMDQGSNCDFGPERWEMRVWPASYPEDSTVWRLYDEGEWIITSPDSVVAWRLYDSGEWIATSPSSLVEFDLAGLERENTTFFIRAVNAAGVESGTSQNVEWPDGWLDSLDDEYEDEDDYICVSPTPQCCSMVSQDGAPGLLASLVVVLGFVGLVRRRSQGRV